MRNLSFILLVSTVLLGSCSQDFENMDTQQTTSNEVSRKSMDGITVSEQGFLQFSDVGKYEETLQMLSNYSDHELNEWENAMDFESSFRHYNISDVDAAVHEDPDTGEEVRPNIPGFNNGVAEDDLLLRIIDKNGMIQIGNFVFAAFMDNGFVLEMDAIHIDEHYQDLVDGAFDPDIMNKFNGRESEYLGTYESIFELLEETNPTGINPGNYSPVLFGSKHVLTGPRDHYLRDNLGLKNYFGLKTQNVYQTAVFYYSLINKSWVQTRTLSVWIKYYNGVMQYVNLSTDQVFYKSNKNGSSHVDKSQQYSTFEFPEKQKVRVYEGSRGLKYFTFETTIRWKTGSGAAWQPPVRVTLYKY